MKDKIFIGIIGGISIATGIPIYNYILPVMGYLHCRLYSGSSSDS
jgi:hypothetical protein